MITAYADKIALGSPKIEPELATAITTLKAAPWQGEDVIFDLLSWQAITPETLSSLQALSAAMNAQQNSLVVVSTLSDIPPDDPSLAVVPTLHEAEDYIRFEQMQRDLGL